ncbi:MAG: hypothetical protein WCF18_10205 [Chthoniobacteraceae bacterium]
MKTRRLLFAVLLFSSATAAWAFDDWLDHVGDALSFSAFGGNVRAKLSGMLDLEGYYLQQPPPGLIFTPDRALFNPRFTTFLDAQLGPNVYAFVQARVDRGFDPHDADADVRLDEYAVRVTPWEDGRFSLQIGKFGTVIGNWVERHLSWDNPFVTAPLPYENLTGIWDSAPADSGDTLRFWGHVGRNTGDVYADKHLRLPIVWGPSYTSGVSVAGRLGVFDYAAEMKNASLSSRPESWDVTEIGFENPTFSGRLGFRPNQMWNLGVSASSGTYLYPDAKPFVPKGRSLGAFRELVLAQDIGFAWHHFQLWAEFFETRFTIPNVGDADTFAYYIEAKYKVTTQLAAALRWNHQLYDSIGTETGRQPWGNDLRRLDAALIYRFSPHTQLKVQYSIASEENAPRDYSHTLAGQLTVKF